MKVNGASLSAADNCGLQRSDEPVFAIPCPLQRISTQLHMSSTHDPNLQLHGANLGAKGGSARMAEMLQGEHVQSHIGKHKGGRSV